MSALPVLTALVLATARLRKIQTFCPFESKGKGRDSQG